MTFDKKVQKYTSKCSVMMYICQKIQQKSDWRVIRFEIIIFLKIQFT